MIWIGTSGWNYPEWRGRFYPKGLAQRRWLEHISRRVNSVEINGSFYRLQKPEHYQSWAAQTPDDFVFAVKGSRFITHMKRLFDVDDALTNFFASGVFLLGRKLGPILWQLPASTRFDPDRLAAFFDKLPRSTETGQPVRHALEPRHPSFTEPTFLDLLREHQIALVIADTAGKFPYLEDITTSMLDPASRSSADFAYVRLHGDEELYASDYSETALDAWAKKVRDLAGATDDVYVYFDNDINAHAPWNAISLAERLATPG